MNRAQEIAWAAGVLEGEGCFTRQASYTRKDGSKLYAIAIRCAMGDGDVVRRLHRVLRVGRVYYWSPPSHRKRGFAPQYVLGIYARQARGVMRLILPYMCKRRSARIRQLLRGDFRTIAETTKAKRKS